MKKNVFLLMSAFLLALTGCVQDKDMYSPNLPENGNDFSLFDKISVQSSLPDGTLCLLFTSYPYEDGSLVTEPVMTAYAPFNNTVRIPEGVDKLYVYANGLLKEYPRGNINVEGTGVTKAMTRADSRPSTPGAYDWIPLSDAFIAAIHAFYPEAQLNITEADRAISTDLVAPKGVKEIIEHPDGSKTEIEWGNTNIWITYVSNGGSNMTGDLWYYTYKVDANGTPITSLEDIEKSLVRVFTKAYPGRVEPQDGPGKRVYLGEFEPGTRIGFKFFGNAYIGSGTSNPFYKYSTPHYNNLAYKSITTVIRNATCGVIRKWEYGGATYATLGMENRLPKENGYDGDYNDMICLIEADPLVIENKIDPPTPPIESIKWKGYWLFEDQYPNEGDYDFNDVVVKYAITETGELAIIDMQFMARGAGYTNNFGINGKIYYEGLTGYANVYADAEKVDQPYKQVTMNKATEYIPMLNNGMVSFDLKTFNQYNLDFPNILEIPIVDNSKFLWCIEKTRIDVAYPRYKEWVKSKCTTNTDWYKDTPVAGTVWDK